MSHTDKNDFVCLYICMFFLSGGGYVAYSSFIRAMHVGKLFQTGETSALAFDLPFADSLILSLLYHYSLFI